MRGFVPGVLAWVLAAGVAGCGVGSTERQEAAVPGAGSLAAGKVVKSDAQWRASLTPQQYRITRKKGTERAFTGAYWNNEAPGTYVCVCCGAPLYASEAKFDSGSGWPSFRSAIREDAVATAVDHSLLGKRTELLCRRCDAHLGHLFADGPPPTGMRHCVNSAALRFVPSRE